MDTESEIITYKTYDTPFAAYEAKNILEANGVPAFVTNENMATLYPIFNEDISGVRLQIFEKDKALADKIFNSPSIEPMDGQE